MKSQSTDRFTFQQKRQLFELRRVMHLHTKKAPLPESNGNTQSDSRKAGGSSRSWKFGFASTTPPAQPAAVSIRLVAVGGLKGRSEIVAVYCSNDCLILRRRSMASLPVVKMLSWHRSAEERITAMDFSPQANQLLCVTAGAGLVLLSVDEILSASSVVGNKLPSARSMLSEAHELPSMYSYVPQSPSRKKRESRASRGRISHDQLRPPAGKGGELGLVTCCTWWRTWNGVDYAIIGTTQGLVVFHNLTTHDEQVEVRISKSEAMTVLEFSLLINPTMQDKELIIKCGDNKHYQLLLEHESDDHTYMLVVHHSSHPDFQPRVMHRFSNARSIRVFKNEQQGPVVAVHTMKNTLEIYDAHLTRFPLFVYRLPFATKDVVLTKHFLFVTHYPEGDAFSKSFSVMSRHLAGIGISGDSSHVFPKDTDVTTVTSIMYTFKLPSSEIICGISNVQPPFELQRERTAKMLVDATTRKTEEMASLLSLGRKGDLSSIGESLDVESLLDEDTQSLAEAAARRAERWREDMIEGILVWAEESLYELTPISSVASIFHDLAREERDLTECEMFAKSVGGDVYKLYEETADQCFDDGEYDDAYNMYMLSNVNVAKFLFRFLSIGRIGTAVAYLDNLLKRPGSLERGKELQVSVLLLLLKIYAYLSGSETEDTQEAKSVAHREVLSLNALRQFVLSRENVPTGWALLDLLTYGISDIFLELSEVQDNVAKALAMLISRGVLILSPTQIDFLKRQGSYQLLHTVGGGAIFRCLPTYEQIRLLLSTQDSIMNYGARLLYRMQYLSEEDHRFIISRLNPQRKDVLRLITSASVSPQNNVYRNLRHVGAEASLMGSKRKSAGHGDSIASEKLSAALLPEEVLEIYISSLLTIVRLEEVKAEDGNESKGDPSTSPDLASKSSGRSGMVGEEIEGDHRYSIVKVSAGDTHILMVSESGDIYSAGSNFHGQLGHGDREGRSTPQRISKINGTVETISCGKGHSAAVTSKGILYTWGGNAHGQLGFSNPKTGDCSTTPVEIKGPLEQETVVDVECGSFYTHVLTDSGEAYGFGNNDFGQLGVDTGDEEEEPELLECIYVPTKIDVTPFVTTLVASPSQEIVHSTGIVALSSGYCHTMAVTESGELFAWGHNGYGQLGLGQKKTKFVMKPTRVDFFTGSGGTKVTKVSCGSFHTAVLTEDEGIYTFGKGQKGRLGLSYTQFDYALPQRPSAACMEGVRIADISCGHFHTLCATTSGRLYVWGHNSEGQLGLGDLEPRLTPVPLPLANTFIHSVECGEEFSLALTTEHKLMVWGSNENNQLGSSAEISGGDYTKVKTPFSITLPSQTASSEEINLSSGTTRREEMHIVLNRVLRSNFGQYRAEKVLLRCLDLNNWEAASTIYELMGEPLNAVFCLLRHVEKSLYDLDSGRKKVSLATQVVYLPQVVSQILKIVSGNRVGNLESLRIHILTLSFWHEHNLDVVPLELGLIKNLKTCLKPLGLLLDLFSRPNGLKLDFSWQKIQQSEGAESSDKITDPDEVSIPDKQFRSGGRMSGAGTSPRSPTDILSTDLGDDSSLDSFGDVFIRRSSTVDSGLGSEGGSLDGVEKYLEVVSPREAAAIADDASVPAGTKSAIVDVEKLFGVLGLRPPPPGRPFYANFSHNLYVELLDVHLDNLKARFEDNSGISVEKTWNEITHILQKDLERRKYISIPIKRRMRTESETSEVQRSIQVNGSGDATQPGEKTRNMQYIFTCGHSFDRSTFITRILPKFRELMEATFNNSAPITTALFLHAYGGDVIKLPCPVCVYNYLRVDRAISVKYPSLPWMLQ